MPQPGIEDGTTDTYEQYTTPAPQGRHNLYDIVDLAQPSTVSIGKEFGPVHGI